MKEMRKLGITPTLTLVFVLFASAVLVGLGIPAYNNGRAALQAATVSELLTTTLEKQAALGTWVADRQHSIGDIANQTYLRETVTALIAAAPGSSGATQSHADLVSDLRNWAGEGHRFMLLDVIDAATGRVIAATDAGEEGKFREEHLYFINGLQAPYVQNPYYDLSRQQPSMTASAPIKSPDGRVIAVLAGPLNLDEMNAIIQRRSGLHQTDDSFLVNTSNLFVTQPRLNTDPAVLQRGVHTEAINRCLVHESGVVASDDYRGVPVIGNYRWLPERQLCLITKIDQAEAFAPSRALASTMAVTGGLVLLIGSIVAIGMSRTIARPVLQLVQGAIQIGQGNLDYRIKVKSGDEIGNLACAFNDMAAKLQTAKQENDILLEEQRNFNQVLERRVEERTSELSESEERFRFLAENARDMIYHMSLPGGFYEYVSPASREIFGYSPEEFYINPILIREAIHPDWRSYFEDAWADLLKGFAPPTYEYKIVHKSGAIRWLNQRNVLIKNENGIPVAIEANVTDITERKRVEEELHLKNIVFNASISANSIANIDGIITNVNPAFLKLWGYVSEAAAIGNSVGSFFVNDADAIPVLEALNKTGRWEGEFLAKSADGSTFISRGLASAIYDINGVHIGYQSANLDVTDQKRTEEHLKKTMSDLARSNAELERFAYVASHDLQEPLRMVSSYLQLLERRYKDRLDGDALEFISYAMDGSDRMKTLINDLLAYSRVGTRGKDFALTDCEEVLTQALTNLKVSIEENKAIVSHDPLPSIIADDVQLESLFQNLIGNALKFHGKKKPKIHVGVEQKGKEWVFSVSDNGIGIDPHYFDRIFIIFQRLHNRETYPGTGIGLAISKRVVERHGGRIWAESEPGKGATFYFTMPVSSKAK
jgi:PAS domain S-box-containing protein